MIDSNCINTTRIGMNAIVKGNSNDCCNTSTPKNLGKNFMNSGRITTTPVNAGGDSKCSDQKNNSEVPNNRRISMCETAQLPPLLQQLASGQFGEIVSDQECSICFHCMRHQENFENVKYQRQPWRIRERMKTASVALVLCLNIGVDPPDVMKIQPCARLECWIDPSSVSAPKAMELIGTNLQMQYERWQPRARYKKCHDPTVDDVKKLCTSLRRNAKGERILFHYNGHGVPKPTANGEIWVFNKTFTQYIPLSIFELQNWMAAPSIYVYDCSNSGIIIQSFLQFAEQHERELEKMIAVANQRTSINNQSTLPPHVSFKNCIHLAACSVNEILPMNAQLPADLFTSCLTTPINIALKWYAMRENFDLIPKLHSEFIDKIPGKVNDRRTMLGELNWIFTAITDTIAWNMLPRQLFQKLFRQDLLVASLFRNFLLAERILKSHDCTPVSHPMLPPCFRHSMWTAWDLVVDLALRQLPDILERGAAYKQLPFFEEQLTAFQVWLDRESKCRIPPEQLPIVLQVLLSQVHRLRALELLARFLDLGPWAVNLALGVGIFPYVLKLLQSSAKDLRSVLVFIWAKILAVDPTCQVDLVKDNKYFLLVLQDTTISKENRILSAFVLSCIVNNFLIGQTTALQGSLISVCLEQLSDDNWLLRQWLIICLGMLWQNFEKARWSGVRDLAHDKLYPLLKDVIPEVRAAAVFALGTFISSVTDRSKEHANNIDRIIAITLIENVGDDMSPLVRRELVAALQWMVLLFESQFITVYMQEYMPPPVTGERGSNVNYNSATCNSISAAQGLSNHSTHSLERYATMRRGISSSVIASTTSAVIPFHSIFSKLWQGIYKLSYDPHPKVALTAQKIVEYVRDAALCLITAKEAGTNEKYTNLSLSLPPSPNDRISYLSSNNVESLPAEVTVKIVSHNSMNPWNAKLRNTNSDTQSMLQRKLRTVSMNDETDSTSSHNAASNIDFIEKSGEGSISDHSSNSDTNYEPKLQKLKPIVTTDFISWATSYFTLPETERYELTKNKPLSSQTSYIDKNSPTLRAREYRFERNRLVRHQAKEQQLQAIRFDHQTWMRKTQHTPTIIKLLPYENQMAVAYREKVMVYDWHRNTVKTCVPTAIAPPIISIHGKSPSSYLLPYHIPECNIARVTSLEFLNAQDIALTLVGHEDGVIRVWQVKPNDFDDDSSRLVSAWVAMPSLHTSYVGGFSGVGMSLISKQTRNLSVSRTNGLLTTWQQCSHQLVVAGGCSRFLRIWDVQRELRLSDIPLGSENDISVLSPFPNNIRSELIAVGCHDGSVRLYDKRCSSQDALLRVYREHTSSIVSVCLKDNQTSLVTACSQGKVCSIDLRSRLSSGVMHKCNIGIGNDNNAIAIHQATDLIACGGTNKIILYNTQDGGRVHSTLRCHESFMGPKGIHSTCLAFHSYKISLAVGFIDNTVAVYEPSPEFYKKCNRWKMEVDKNPQTFDNVRKFLQGAEMSSALKYMQNKLQLPTMNISNIRLIYTICAFETAWKRNTEYSIWCQFLNRNVLRILEFVEDLEYYWNDGYGYELTSRIACAILGDMFKRINPKSSLPNSTFYFTHSGTLLKMLAHLNLYKDLTPLTYKDFKSTRSWRTSFIDAFGTNVAFVLYECSHSNGNNEPMVLTMHQERVVRIPGCPRNFQLCKLADLRKIFANSINNCNFATMCY